MVKEKLLDRVRHAVKVLISALSSTSQLVKMICGFVLIREWSFLACKKGGVLRGK